MAFLFFLFILNCDSADSGGSSEEEKTNTPGFVPVTGGAFTMGSPESEGGRKDDEDLHQVTLTYNFEIAATEVTQKEFSHLMGYNPSKFSSCGDDCPVESVSWHEAIAFCNVLSGSRDYEECFDCSGSGKEVKECKLKDKFTRPQECKGYRLPTEAEWEYAARAGSGSAFYSGDITEEYGLDPNLDKIGWFDFNSDYKIHPVKGKEANVWGLYDMSGNVVEWVWDWREDYLSGPATDPVGPVSGDRRSHRGGSYSDHARTCRSAFRSHDYPDSRLAILGLRVVRTTTVY